jgi:protein-S-isoprenylcysteine O-methyltransferase Ste14
MVLIVALSLLVGVLIGAIVLIGNLERTPILRALDSLPGVVAALLTLLCCFSLYHLTHDFYHLSPTLEGIFLCVSLVCAAWMGYRVHRHRSRPNPHTLTQISSKHS